MNQDTPYEKITINVGIVFIASFMVWLSSFSPIYQKIDSWLSDTAQYYASTETYFDDVIVIDIDDDSISDFLTLMFLFLLNIFKLIKLFFLDIKHLLINTTKRRHTKGPRITQAIRNHLLVYCGSISGSFAYIIPSYLFS